MVKIKKRERKKNMLKNKNFIRIVFVIIIALSIQPISMLGSAQEEIQITSGMYFQLGKYKENPILWKSIVSDNENGILMLSDKILCYKNFDVGTEDDKKNRGSNFWEESTLRTWLNSTASAGEIRWPYGKVPNEHRVHKYERLRPGEPYSEEAGFLSLQNFTDSEKTVMKSVSQWQALSQDKTALSENGLNVPFYPKIIYAPHTHMETTMHIYTLPELGTAYYGAMYRISDTMFTMDELQLYELWSQFGTVEAENADGVLDPWYGINDEYWISPNGRYWLRTPLQDYSITVAGGEKLYYTIRPDNEEVGVRPAFYLNEENMVIKSGTGTADDPYIIDGIGEEEIMIFTNGEQVRFDQQPTEESDRLLVPVRAIFESLGAEVMWDEEDEIVTAVKEDRTVVMQIDNPDMGNGIEVVTLEVPPRIIGERTMVPLRAVSEAFDCRVDWIDELKRVVIDPPQPEHSDEGHYQNEWDIVVHGFGKKR